jgi:hypothetical protein
VPAARELFVESTELRRKVGFQAGVAANLVGLAFLADDPAVARAHLDEAATVARECGADAVLGWVAEAEAQLG